MKKLLLSSIILASIFTTYAQQAKKKVVAKAANEVTEKAVTAPVEVERLVEITTNYGVMIAKLYNATPKHRDNFISKVKDGFYDSLLFHRVIKDFMIQGGDPQSKNAPDSVMLGGGSAPGDRVPAEFTPNAFHKKGALAAARDGNPEKASSNCQFYIVQGRKSDTAQLNAINAQINKGGNPNFHYTKGQKEIYERIGGTAQLDQNYTVFGEVISGMDVIDKIASVRTKPGDRPVANVIMKMKLLN